MQDLRGETNQQVHLFRPRPYNIRQGCTAAKWSAIQISREKFDGRNLTDNMKEEEQRKDLVDLTRYLLKLVHETHLVGHQKLWLYQHLIIPKKSWHREILDLRYSFAKMLHHISLSFIKKWAGLPKAANTGWELEEPFPAAWTVWHGHWAVVRKSSAN